MNSNLVSPLQTPPALRPFFKRLDTVLEGLWLLLLFSTPLLVLPGSILNQSYQLRDTVFQVGAMAMIAIIALQFGLRGGLGGLGIRRPSLQARWKSPAALMVLGVLLLATVTILSTLVSVDRSTSLWGFDPRSPKNNLMLVLLLVAWFFMLSSRLRDHAQLWRIAAALALSGTVVAALGILQSFGYAPLGVALTPGERVKSTLGNPIFMSATLVMLIPLTLALAKRALDSLKGRWLAAFWLVAAGSQSLTIMLSLSRGPWIGLAAEAVAFVGLTALFGGRRLTATLVVAMVLLAAVVAVWLTINPPNRVGPSSGDSGGGLSDIQTRVFSIADNREGSITGRRAILKGAWSLSTERPWLPYEHNRYAPLRELVGYGPDTFVFEFMQVQTPELFGDLGVVVNDSAHNRLMDYWVELGIFGLLAFLVVLAAAAWLLWRLLRHRGDSHQANGRLLLTLAIGAALAGNFVEQMFGIAHLVDMLVFWTLLAMLIALAKLAWGPSTPSLASQQQVAVPRALVAAVALVGIVALALLAWLKPVAYLQADRDSVKAVEGFPNVNVAQSFTRLERAQARAPDVPWYYLSQARIYGLGLQALAPDRPLTDGQKKQREQFLDRQYELTQKAYQAVPFILDTIFPYADATLERSRRLGLPVDEARALYLRVVDLAPLNHMALRAAGRALLDIGDKELGEQLIARGDRLAAEAGLP